MLNLMATFAEYEREPIQELAQAGVGSARARGVTFGRPPADPMKAAPYVRSVAHLVKSKDPCVVETARTVGWSKSTCYRYRAAQTPTRQQQRTL